MGCLYDLYCAALAPQKSQSRLEGGKKVEKATNAFCAGFSRASDEARRCLLAISGSRPHPVPHPHLPWAICLYLVVRCANIFFPGPQPSCHPSLRAQYLTPTFIGHLLKQGVPKKLLTVPHPHHWPSAYILLSDVPCVTCVQASSRFDWPSCHP